MIKFSTALLLMMMTGVLRAAEPLPEGQGGQGGQGGPGLAAGHPGDAGIGKHPAVLFHDDFESGDLKKWDDKSGTITVVKDKPNGGLHCVAAPMNKGKDTGGEAKKWFMPGADKVHARVYVKFDPDYQYCHHFLWMSANPRNQKWKSFGKAGLKPDGTYFSSGMEPWFGWGENPSPGEIGFYSYFMDMQIDKKMNKYWGNGFFPPGPVAGKAAQEKTRVVPKLDQWQCWEFMIQSNTPGKADGSQAMWLDGKLIGHFTGIRWREQADLKINCFWLEHYGYDESDPTRKFHKEKQTVWFDDVVIATEYIGLRAAAK